MARVQADLRRHRIPVVPVDTVDDVAEQLREKLGGQQVVR
jgi:hypothetical protein